MTLQIIQIIIEVAILIIGLYLGFFKSYLSEKGKNLATQEDIEKITKKIENVKSEIEILTHQRISLSTEKKNTLLEFNDKYSAWLNYITYVEINGDQPTIDLYYLKVEEKCNQLYYDFMTAQSKIHVYFIDDAELIAIIGDISLKTFSVLSLLKSFLHRAKHAQENKQNSMALPEVGPDNLYKEDRLAKNHKERMDIQEAFQTEAIEQYKSIFQLHNAMLKIIHTRIHDFETNKNLT